jgi:membrane fusion protein
MFRSEALAAAQAHGHGEILLSHSPSHLLLTGMLGAAAAAVLLFLCLFSVQRKAQVSGTLTPSLGLVRVVPSQGGVVAARLVEDGQTVRAGDALYVLSGERSSVHFFKTGQTISSLLEARRESLVADQSRQHAQNLHRLEAIHRRSQELASERRRIDEQIALQQRRISLAQEATKRYGELQAAGFVSAAQVQDRQGELLDQQQRLGELLRVRAVNVRDSAAAESEARDLQLQMQRDEEAIRRAIATLDQDLAENEARRELVIRAPQDGTVTALTAQPGQTVVPNQTLASILPVGAELEAELYAPSRAVGFIHPGMEVLLRYQAFPYQKFGQFRGRVREVSETSLRPDELGVNLNSAEALYRLRIKLERQSVKAYGIDQPLKAGMALEASVLIERRRLIEWVLDPLYSISGRL